MIFDLESAKKNGFASNMVFAAKTEFWYPVQFWISLSTYSSCRYCCKVMVDFNQKPNMWSSFVFVFFDLYLNNCFSNLILKYVFNRVWINSSIYSSVSFIVESQDQSLQVCDKMWFRDWRKDNIFGVKKWMYPLLSGIFFSFRIFTLFSSRIIWTDHVNVVWTPPRHGKLPSNWQNPSPMIWNVMNSWLSSCDMA